MLQKREVIDYYVTHYLSQYGLQAGDKVYAIILDIYTTRYMCRGCSARCYSTIQHKNTALLAAWQKAFIEAGIRIPKTGLRMAIRATGERPAQYQPVLQLHNYKPQTSQWLLNPGKAQINNIVFEADNVHVPVVAGNVINDLFRRTIFLSKEANTDAGYVQERAIDSFKDFLAVFETTNYGLNNPIFTQRSINDPANLFVNPTRVRLLAAQLALLAFPVGNVGRRQIAQNLYLPGVAPLTPQEFHGLYFI